jgi:hypothetical protein
MKKLLLLLFIFNFQLSIFNCYSQTNVSGFINANTTWTFVNSPYIVIGNILLNHGYTLTIEEGVVIKFDSAKVLQIDGELIAKGSFEKRIIFTSNQTSPAAGDWGKIQFADTSIDAVYDTSGNYVSGSIMKYCDVLYGGGIGFGAVQMALASPYITNCHIAYSSNDGIYCTRGVFILDSSSITNCGGWGLNINQPPYYDDIIMYADTFSFNAKGGLSIGPGNYNQKTIIIRNNYFQGNLLYGAIYETSGCDSLLMRENTFLNNNNITNGNAGTVYLNVLFFIIECNRFIGNQSGGLGTLGFTHEAPDGNYIRNNLFQGNSSNLGNAAINFNISHSIEPIHKVHIVDNIFSSNSSNSNPIIKINSWLCADSTFVDFYFNNNTFSNNTAPSVLKFGLNQPYQIATNNFIHFKNNNFLDPASALEIDNAIPYSSPNIEADSNYWGTTNVQHIDSVVRDFFDNGNLSVVFCSAPLLSPVITDTTCPPPITTNIQSSIINNQSTTLFPNPFTTHATLSFNESLHNATLHIYNMYGQLMQQQSNISGREIILQRENLGSGIYIYEVREGQRKVCAGKAVVY